GAARSGDRHERDTAVRGAVTGPRELLADDAAHGTAHEGEVHDCKLARVAVDRSLTDHHRLAQTGLHLRLREAFGVRAEVEEVERILRPEVGRLLDERPVI